MKEPKSHDYVTAILNKLNQAQALDETGVFERARSQEIHLMKLENDILGNMIQS